MVTPVTALPDPDTVALMLALNVIIAPAKVAEFPLAAIVVEMPPVKVSPAVADPKSQSVKVNDVAMLEGIAESGALADPIDPTALALPMVHSVNVREPNILWLVEPDQSLCVTVPIVQFVNTPVLGPIFGVWVASVTVPPMEDMMTTCGEVQFSKVAVVPGPMTISLPVHPTNLMLVSPLLHEGFPVSIAPVQFVNTMSSDPDP
jgi:hypothetical protein